MWGRGHPRVNGLAAAARHPRSPAGWAATGAGVSLRRNRHGYAANIAGSPPAPDLDSGFDKSGTAGTCRHLEYARESGAAAADRAAGRGFGA